MKVNMNNYNSNVQFGIAPKTIAGKTLKNIEFNGFNFSTLGLGIVTYGAVLCPRYLKARDKWEREEILRRDFATITTILFGRRAIQNVVSKLYAKKTGLVLAIKPQVQGKIKQIFNYLRPDNGVHVLSSSQLDEMYTHVDQCKNGLADFADFITTQGGDIKKVLTSDETLKKNLQAAYDSWKSTSKSAKLEEASAFDIRDMIKDLKKSDKDNGNIKAIESFFNDPQNSLAKRAKAMNANFDFLTMLMIIPAIMGVFLPVLNEQITKSALGGKNNKK